MTNTAHSGSSWHGRRPPHEDHIVVQAWAERDRYRAALERAQEQLGKFGLKGPKQVGRALMTIRAALDEEQQR